MVIMLLVEEHFIDKAFHKEEKANPSIDHNPFGSKKINLKKMRQLDSRTLAEEEKSKPRYYDLVGFW